MVKIRKYLKFGDEKVFPGERKYIPLEVAALYDYTKLNIPIEVIRGKEPGPVLFVSAAVHGDEINGVEIIKELLKRPILNRLHGTLICIPVVNIFGFNNLSRYLPDRRDLNRCFPGNANGSLGSRLAYIFMKEIVQKCTHGIDLHTGAIHRTNLPQIRACLDDEETKELAFNFGVPVIINSKLRDGSLREAARKKRVHTLLFEGGEALRYDEDVIRIGVKGCLSIMEKIGMIKRSRKRMKKLSTAVFQAEASYWIRAPHSGSFRVYKKVGDHVKIGDLLAVISDPFASSPVKVEAKIDGIIIGLSTIPLVNRGDAMIHIARFNDSEIVEQAIDELRDEEE